MTENVRTYEEQLELETSVYEKLRKPFDLSCYSVDSSRGFDLASLKAQYIPKRLNEVLGFSNWAFTGKWEPTENGILYFGTLTVKIGDNVSVRTAVGFSAKKKNDGDFYKGAMTDCLSKAASYFGVAEEAFCGLVDPVEIKKHNKGGASKVVETKEKPTRVKKQEIKEEKVPTNTAVNEEPKEIPSFSKKKKSSW